MKTQNTNLKQYIIESIKKLTAKIAIFAVLFNAFNLPFIFFYTPQAIAAPTKISDHKIIDSKNNYLIYGAGRFKNYILTTSSGIAQKLPISNPYNLNISNLDLQINSSISGALFSTGNSIWYNDSVSLSGFNILSSTGILFKTNLTDYQTGNININYSLTESGNAFIYTGSFLIPFETFNPVSGEDYSSLIAISSVQLSKYISTGPSTPVKVIYSTGTTETNSGTTSTGSTNSGTYTTTRNIALELTKNTQDVNEINSVRVKIVDGSGVLLTNTGIINLNLITTSSSGEYSKTYSPFTKITTLSLSGTNETILYYRDIKTGTQTLRITDQNIDTLTNYATGEIETLVKTPIQTTVIGQLNVSVSGATVDGSGKILQGVDKSSDEIYVELKNLSGTTIQATKPTQIKLETTNISDKVSLNGLVWYDTLTTTISSGTSKTQKIYFKSKDTGVKTLKVLNIEGEYQETELNNIKVLNKIDLYTQDKKVIKGELTSKIGFKLTDPRRSKQEKSLGKITYTDNPNDGDYITLDKVTYEFDNNSNITSGRVSIGITDNADATFTKLRDLVNNGGVPSVYTTILTDTNTIYVESKEAGYKGNTITLGKGGSTISIDGSTLGGTRQGTGELVYTNKVLTIQIESSGGIVSLSKTNVLSTTGITLQAGETMGEMYFKANNTSGTGYVKLRYSENTIDWLETTQIIQIEEPRVGFEGENKITKVNTAVKLDVSLKDRTTLSRYISKGGNTIKLTSSSTGGSFSLTNTGTYTNSITLNYGSGESMKSVWYKDENESNLIDGIAQTIITRENIIDNTKKSYNRVVVFENKIGDYYYNNAGIKGLQFNKNYNNEWIMVFVKPYVEGTGLGAFRWLFKTAYARDNIFDAVNMGVKVFKLNTSNELNTYTPNTLKSSSSEINDYNVLKSVDGVISSVSSGTGGENTLFLYEYTLSGISNEVKEIKHYNYGYSTSSGNIFAIWNGTNWQNIGENNDIKLTGIPTIGTINNNISNYISSNKVYILSSSKNKSTIDKQIDLYSDYIKLNVIDNKAPEITITSIGEGFYKGDKNISYIASDYDGDKLSIKLEYSTDSGSTWKVGSIETSNSDYIVNNYNSTYRQLNIDSSNEGINGKIVWRSITDLPYSNSTEILVKISIKDNYGEKSSIISTTLDNEIEWESNSSPVIVDSGDANKVVFKKPAIYNEDNTESYVEAIVTDIFDNPVIGDLNKLSFVDNESNILTGAVDNNNGSYTIKIPVRSVVSQVELYNFDKTIVNKLNSRKMLFNGKTISNGYIDIIYDGQKLNEENSIYTGDNGEFEITSDHIMTNGNHKLKLKVTPAGGGLETSSLDITVTHSGITSGFNTDNISIATEGTVGETTYNLQVNQDNKVVVLKNNIDNIYSTKYPVFIGYTRPNTSLDIYSGSTYLGKTISDNNGLFEYESNIKLNNGSYVYRFKYNETVYFDNNFKVDTDFDNISIYNIFSNANINTQKILISGAGKSNNVIEISYKTGAIFEKISENIVDENGRFELFIDNKYIKTGINIIKITDKKTLKTKYLSFNYKSDFDCDKSKCIDISNIGLVGNSYITLNGVAKQTKLNSSAIYVYLRKASENKSMRKLIGVISTYSKGEFNYNSLEKVSGEYILDIKYTDTDYEKSYYLNSSYNYKPYIINKIELDNGYNIKYYINSNTGVLKNKFLDLSGLTEIDYTSFESKNINNNGYFEENVYSSSTGSLIFKIIDSNNNSYTTIIE